MTVPQALIDQVNKARAAMEDAQGEDGHAADAAAAVELATANANKATSDALAAHQEANKQATEALHAVSDFLQGIDTSPATSPATAETPEAPAPQEKVAGRQTMRK